jgi:hypothetical protein
VSVGQQRRRGSEAVGTTWRRWLYAGVVVLLLGQMLAAMLLSAAGDAPTDDEPSHLGSGVATVVYGDLRWEPEHPPLAKILAVAGLELGGVHTVAPPAHPAGFDQGALGRQVLFDPHNSPRHVLWMARVPLIILTALFGLVVLGFATDLFGAMGGLLALAVYTVCPTVITHGRLVTTDMAGAGFLLLTAWMLWRAANRSLFWLVPSGVAFGLALLAKSSGLFVAPVVFLLAVVAADRHRAEEHGESREGQVLAAIQAIGVIVIAFAVIWIVYLALDPGQSFNRSSLAPGGLLDHVANLLPLPRAYRVGLQDATIIGRGSPAYLFGRRYVGGSALFFPALLLIKTPIASLGLWVLGAIAAFRLPKRLDTGLFVVSIPLVILIIGVVSSLNIGIRHVIAVPIFMAVLAGAAVHLHLPRIPVIAAALIALAAASTWSQYPAYLAYTNEAFGGPGSARKLMSDSNVDWGQDLIRLRSYLRSHPTAEQPWLYYFGDVDPAAYGIHARGLNNANPADVHGRVIISVTALDSFGVAPFLEHRRPVTTIGHSILIYNVP